jgi:PPOX class probable F420-dependent enzyme
MSAEDILSFLAADPPHTAKVATTRADGRPHVAPVWFTLDEDRSIVFNTGLNTLKGRNLSSDPRLCVCVDDERPPFTFAIVDGTAELIDDLAVVRRWAAVIGGRYMGAERAEEYGQRNGVAGELLVRVHAERMTGMKDLAD